MVICGGSIVPGTNRRPPTTIASRTTVSTSPTRDSGFSPSRVWSVILCVISTGLGPTLARRFRSGRRVFRSTCIAPL